MESLVDIEVDFFSWAFVLELDGLLILSDGLGEDLAEEEVLDKDILVDWTKSPSSSYVGVVDWWFSIGCSTINFFLLFFVFPPPSFLKEYAKNGKNSAKKIFFSSLQEMSQTQFEL